MGRKIGETVGYLSGQREQTVNLPANAFEGSNPSPTIFIEGSDFFMTAVVSKSAMQLFAIRSELAVRKSVSSTAGVAQLVER